MTDLSKAAIDVLAERQRQVEAEGWTPEHDDKHAAEELAQAAACYAMPLARHTAEVRQTFLNVCWPWGREWWKPTNRRRDLVKAAALILAEIERLDRKDDAALAAAEQRGREAAAQKLDRRVTQIVNDYGDYEPDTNATNIPDDWELVCQELEDLAVAIRKGGELYT